MAYCKSYEQMMAYYLSHKRFRVVRLKHIIFETNDPHLAVQRLAKEHKAKLCNNAGYVIMKNKELLETHWNFQLPKTKSCPNDPFAPDGMSDSRFNTLSAGQEVLHRVAEYYKRASSGLEPPYLPD